jgi:hypothetical protein
MENIGRVSDGVRMIDAVAFAYHPPSHIPPWFISLLFALCVTTLQTEK